jgi:hypothetical protein
LGATVIAAEIETATLPFSRSKAEAALKRLHHFVDSRMTDSRGAIRVNAVKNRAVLEGEARNGEFLSETVGQRMELALLEWNRKDFEKQLALVIEVFAGPSGLLAWKVSDDLSQRAKTSATIDDWRVAYCCKLAYDRWQIQAAFDYGLKVATVLAQATLENGLMIVALDLQEGRGEKARLPLCYLHLPAMKAWTPHLTSLEQTLKKASSLLLKGRRPNGLLTEAWDSTTFRPIDGKSDEVLTLIAMMNLQAIQQEKSFVEEALRRRTSLLELKVPYPQAFDTVSGNAEQEPAGPAVYALLARFLLRSGDIRHAEMALDKMLSFQQPSSGRFAGALGEDPIYSFDQLEGMLALQEYLKYKPVPAKSGSKK